jgi:CRISPR-associated protein Cas1
MKIVDMSERPAYLSISLDRLQVSFKDNEEIQHIPCSDIGVLLLNNPQVVLSQSVIPALNAGGAAVVFCDRAHLPVSLALPVDGNCNQTKRLHQQIGSLPKLKKQIWTRLVKAKISNQDALLLKLTGERRLLDLEAEVLPGDPTNRESAAAVRYWKLLFGPTFKREKLYTDQNSLLNYGYTVLFATMARAIVTSGLHPSLGVFHSNQTNAFCLASDLMEPLRPVVDAFVHNCWKVNPGSVVNKGFKRYILQELTDVRHRLVSEERSAVPDLCKRLARSLVSVLAYEEPILYAPLLEL